MSSKPLKFSVVIPVYNSEKIVGATVDRTVAYFENRGCDYEIILINDGSPDNSWEVISEKAVEYKNVIAINLLKNYGQHNANMCGLKQSDGDYVITMDDDLQNPPEEIDALIDKVSEGYDLVIGEFRQKQHAAYRKVGTKLIGLINKHIFHTPDGIVLSNFRIISRGVVDRVCDYKTSYPYVPGLVIWFSRDIANTLVDHQARNVGSSNYNMFKILQLVATILFNYSSLPLRAVAAAGGCIAFLSFLLGLFYVISAALGGVSVPGWSTLVVLLSFFNGVMLLMLSMLGEYVVRLLKQTSSSESYYVKDMVQ